MSKKCSIVLDGYNSVEVLFNSSRVRTNFDPESVTIEEIEKAIEDLGYPVIRSRVKSA